MASRLYVRIRGKVMGPFDDDQLRSMRDRSQLCRFHEISEDRQTWRSASSHPLFQEHAGKPAPTPSQEITVELPTPAAILAPQAPPPELWYFAGRGGQQQGPVPATQLLALRRAGKILDTTLVWREGLAEWQPLNTPTLGLVPAPTASLPPQLRAAPPRNRRAMLMAAGIAAGVLICVTGMSLLVLHVPRQPDAPVASVQTQPATSTQRALALDTALRQAGAALMASETSVWTLEGHALKEAQAVLAGAEARGKFGAETAAENGAQREKRLREYLRAKRSSSALAGASAFIDSLNSDSRRFLSDTAARFQMKPEDLLLEWLTYEGALDFGMITRIWREQGNFRGEAATVVRSLLQGLTEPPTIAQGVQVVTQTDTKIVVHLFGATVIEEVLTDGPARGKGEQVIVPWKSNYGYIRDILRGNSPKILMEEQLSLEEGRYRVDYKEWFEDYLAGGHRQLWATELFEESALAVASSADNEKIREKLGKKPTEEPRSRQSLRELFARLAPAVPVIELTGLGDSGSGFLVRQGQKYLVITNRHVIEGARNGLDVHFITTSSDGTETRRTVPSRQATVISIHRKADVAVIDVTPAAGDIREWGVQPVTLAPSDYVPPVGEHVFAIGHPGAGDSRQTLTRTLSDGIVSAMRRELPGTNATCIQITVPLNPGNSGGPLFDDEGRVVGVNTYIIRKNRNRDLALEALNFSLQISYVYELLNDPSASLGERDIALVLSPQKLPEASSSLAAKIRTRHEQVLAMGYRPYEGAGPYTVTFTLRPGEAKQWDMNVMRADSYVVSVVSTGAEDLDIAIWTRSGTLIAADTEPNADPMVSFTAPATGRYTVVVSNESDSPGTVCLRLYRK